MKTTSARVAACLLSLCIGSAASGQSPSPAPAAQASATPPAKDQTLSQKIANDSWNKRRLAIRAVNLKYIDLTKDAAAQFLKEKNQAKADEANTWIKNLVWANDANLKGLEPDAKDRLGVLQAAYLKERVNAIITADNASVDDVENAILQATQNGDQASLAELTKQEERIKQELGNVNKVGVPAAPPAVQASQPVSQPLIAENIDASYHEARSAAVKTVNQKYIPLANDAADLYLKENNQAGAAAAKEWARKMEWTDDPGNLGALFPDDKERLGILQTKYLAERTDAVKTLNTAWLDKVASVQKKADPSQAEALALLSGHIKMQLGLKEEPPKPLTAPSVPTVAVATPAPIHTPPPISTPPPIPGAPASEPTPALTAAAQTAHDYQQSMTEAVTVVNQKYIALANNAAALYLKEGNPSKAAESKDWARRLQWTDGGNLLLMSGNVTDRMGLLQTAYLKERAATVTHTNKTWLVRVENAFRKANQDGDTDGAGSLTPMLAQIEHDLGISEPAPPPTASHTEHTEPGTASSSPPPQTTKPPTNSGYHPFGVEADKLNPSPTP